MNRSWIYISERKKHCFPSSEKFNEALSVNLKPGRKSVDNFARTSSGSLVPILVVFSATLIKCPDRKHLRKKRLIRANGSIIHSTRVGGCGGRSSAHVVILSLSSGHTESWWLVLCSFSASYTPLSQRMVLPTLRGSSNLIYKIKVSQWCKATIPQVTPEHIIVTVKITIHNSRKAR